MKKNFSLSHHDHDLTKRWYIKYTWTDKANRAKTGKYYGGINRGKTVSERLKLAKEAMLVIQNPIPVVKQDANEARGAFTAAFINLKLSLRPRSYSTYSGKVKAFILFLEKNKITKLKNVTADAIKPFFHDLINSVAPKTYNTYIATLQRVASDIPNFENPFLSIKKVADQTTPKAAFTQPQMELIKANIDQNSQLWLACQLMFYCLIRPNEIRTLLVSDVDLVTGTIMIRGVNSKNKKTQRVAIPNAFLPTLIAMKLHNYPSDYYLIGKSKDGKPSKSCWSDCYLRKQFRSILTELGFSFNHSFYSLKHNGAMTMVKEGIHIKYIQLQGRWHDLDQVNSYLNQLGIMDMSEIREKHVM